MHGYIWPINFSRTRTATRACGVTTPDCGEGSQASQLVAAWLVAGADEVEVNCAGQPHPGRIVALLELYRICL